MMSILNVQYASLSNPNDRIEFRTELLNYLKKHHYNTEPLKSVLEEQNLTSLKRLTESLNIILSREINSQQVQTIMMMKDLKVILEQVNIIISHKQQDVPVDLDAFRRSLDKSIFRITPNENKAYLIIDFEPVLSIIMRKIFDEYQYEDQEVLGFARVQDRMLLRKASLQGKENQIIEEIQQELVLRKPEILRSLKEKLERAIERCVSTPARRDDANLQGLVGAAQYRLNQIDRLIDDPHITVNQIISQIIIQKDVCYLIDNGIQLHKSNLAVLERQSIFHQRLQELATGSRSPGKPKLSTHEWSNYEIENLLSIYPRDNDSFATLYINRESETFFQLVEEIFQTCCSSDPKSLLLAHNEEMMFLDKCKLLENPGIIDIVKEQISTRQTKIMADLKQSVELSMQRCCADERRQNSPELKLLVKQGQDKLTKLEQCEKPEQLIQLIHEIGQYRQTVSDAIDVFKRMNTIPGMNK